MRLLAWVCLVELDVFWLKIIVAFFCDEYVLFKSIEHPPTMYVSANFF